MLWVGLTGSIGSGKSTAAKILREMGYSVLDADQAARQALSPGMPAEAEVLKLFGTSERRALGKIVFSDPAKLLQLEQLIHPYVKKEVLKERQQLEQQGAEVAFYDVPLLFEKQMEKDFDLIL